MTPKQRIDRIERAKREAARVKRWERRGSKGERPPTPTLDAIGLDVARREARRIARQGLAGVKPTPRKGLR